MIHERGTLPNLNVKSLTASPGYNVMAALTYTKVKVHFAYYFNELLTWDSIVQPTLYCHDLYMSKKRRSIKTPRFVRVCIPNV